MAKQVLGRNLDALMAGGVKKADNAEAAPPQKAPVSSGVRSLMRGHQPTVVVPAEPEPVAAKESGIPRWYLLAGDLLLAALALIVICKSSHPVSWQKEVFCATAVLLGACLALSAVLLGDDEE